MIMAAWRNFGAHSAGCSERLSPNGEIGVAALQRSSERRRSQIHHFLLNAIDAPPLLIPTSEIGFEEVGPFPIHHPHRDDQGRGIAPFFDSPGPFRRLSTLNVFAERGVHRDRLEARSWMYASDGLHSNSVFFIADGALHGDRTS